MNLTLMPILAEVSDKISSLAIVWCVGIAFAVVGVVLCQRFRLLGSLFIPLAAILFYSYAAEYWEDPYFWHAVTAEQGAFYHFSSLALSGGALAAFIWALFHRRRSHREQHTETAG
jgi:hypothetical protein